MIMLPMKEICQGNENKQTFVSAYHSNNFNFFIIFKYNQLIYVDADVDTF